MTSIHQGAKPPKSESPPPRSVHCFGKPAVLLLLELFVAVALTVNFFYLVRTQCLPKRHGNIFPARTFAYCSQRLSSDEGLAFASWRTRVLAPALSSGLMDLRIKEPVNFQSKKYHNFKELIESNEFKNVFGFYHSAWLFLSRVARQNLRRSGDICAGPAEGSGVLSP